MTKRSSIKSSVHLILLGDGSLRPFIGVHAIPNRLPEMLRYPGESAQAFSHRVLHAVAGSGVVRGMLMYPDELGSVSVPSPPKGTSQPKPVKGNSNRVETLVGQLSAR